MDVVYRPKINERKGGTDFIIAIKSGEYGRIFNAGGICGRV